MSEKPQTWAGSSLDDLRGFPDDARREAWVSAVPSAAGLLPSDWKPTKTVGPGVVEIRVHTRLEHRVFYVAKFEEAVYVLHAFEKRTEKTPQSDIALAQRRLADVMQSRAKQKK